MKKVFAFLLVFIFLISNAFANSSSYYDGDGATIFPIENKSIVMKKEIVKIKPKPKTSGWLAECEFVFYNKGESEEMVTMGYPDWLNTLYIPGNNGAFWKYFDSLPLTIKKNYEETGFDAGYGYIEIYFEGYKDGKLPYINSAWNLHDLKVTIDGNKQQTKHKPIDVKIKIKKRYKMYFSANAAPPSAAFAWKVNFKPKETKTVKVSFSFGGLSDAEGYAEASYLLQTGALWADTIGEADIYWDIKGQDIDMKRTFPLGYEFKNNIIHWHFENFEPTDDISIFEGHPVGYSTGNPTLSLIKDIFRVKKQYEGNARYYTDTDLKNDRIKPDSKEHKLYIKALRNEIYARHGREFSSEELNDIFIDCNWYTPNKNYSDDMLNEYEKKNIEFISEYEKQKGWHKGI